MMKAVVSGIEWETDGEEVDLPSSVTVEVEDGADDDDVIDKLSDKYGWLIKRVGRIVHCGARPPGHNKG